MAEPDALLRRLAGIAERHDVLRMKGFVAVPGKPMRLLVQGVGARFEKSFDRPWGTGEARRGRLVVIGEKGIDRGAIEREIVGEAMAGMRGWRFSSPGLAGLGSVAHVGASRCSPARGQRPRGAANLMVRTLGACRSDGAAKGRP